MGPPWMKNSVGQGFGPSGSTSQPWTRSPSWFANVHELERPAGRGRTRRGEHRLLAPGLEDDPGLLAVLDPVPDVAVRANARAGQAALAHRAAAGSRRSRDRSGGGSSGRRGARTGARTSRPATSSRSPSAGPTGAAGRRSRRSRRSRSPARARRAARGRSRAAGRPGSATRRRRTAPGPRRGARRRPRPSARRGSGARGGCRSPCSECSMHRSVSSADSGRVVGAGHERIRAAELDRLGARRDSLRRGPAHRAVQPEPLAVADRGDRQPSSDREALVPARRAGPRGTAPPGRRRRARRPTTPDSSPVVSRSQTTHSPSGVTSPEISPTGSFVICRRSPVARSHAWSW